MCRKYLQTNPTDILLYAMFMSVLQLLAQQAWSSKVLSWYKQSGVARGPRPRTGVHVGEVTAEVSRTTCRLTYRGRVMNRTSRIAHKAGPGQVLCSSDAWTLVETLQAAAWARLVAHHTMDMNSMSHTPASLGPISLAEMPSPGRTQGVWGVAAAAEAALAAARPELGEWYWGCWS